MLKKWKKILNLDPDQGIGKSWKNDLNQIKNHFLNVIWIKMKSIKSFIKCPLCQVHWIPLIQFQCQDTGHIARVRIGFCYNAYSLAQFQVSSSSSLEIWYLRLFNVAQLAVVQISDREFPLMISNSVTNRKLPNKSLLIFLKQFPPSVPCYCHIFMIHY